LSKTKVASLWTHAAGILAVLIFVFLFGLRFEIWKYSPYLPGNDSIHHSYLIRYVMNYWPHSSWNFQWAGGMPQFRYYPSIPYYIMAFVASATGFSAELTLILFVALSLCLIGIGTFAFTYKIGNNSQASIIASLLLLTTPAVWSLTIYAGLQVRLVGLMFLPLSLWSVAKYTAERDRSARPRNLVVTIILVALAISFHPVYGLATLLSILILVLYWSKGLTSMIYRSIAICGSALLLNSYLLLPYVYYPPPNMRFLWLYEGPTLSLLFRLPTPDSWLALSPMMIPIAIAVLLLSIRKKKISGYSFNALAEAKALGLLSLATVAFISAGAVYRGGPYYLWTPVGPGEALIFLPFVLAPFEGVSLARLYGRIPYLRKKVFLTLILCGLIVSSPLIYRTYPVVVSEEQLIEQLVKDNKETMHRVGIYVREGSLGMWWNYKSPTPQTRDYFSQGILNPEWISWLYFAVWNQSSNYQETNFLLDWWAIKWIIVNEGTSDPRKFFSRPENFHSVTNVSSINEFVFSNASPIVSAVRIPSMLVIGKDVHYRAILESLAHSDYNSRYIIPIHGGEYVDDYSIEDLKKFDAVILYGFNFHDDSKSSELLRKYVEAGGGLILETSSSPYENASSIPLPSPVGGTTKRDFGTEWRLSYIINDVTESVEFTDFSPPVYGVGPWAFSASLNESVRPWAQTILWNHGHPLVVAGEYGKGRVVWSGMNLPWHVASYRSYEESKFLAKIIEFVSGGLEKTNYSTQYEAKRINPERVEIDISNVASGVLFKENYFKDWHAFLEKDGGKIEDLKIYRAGPDFMYVTIPNNAQFPLKVVFEFDKWIEYVGLSITLATALAMILYGAYGEKITKPLGRKRGVLAGLKRKIEDWWYKEE